MNALEVIEAPKQEGLRIEPSQRLREMAHGLYELTDFKAFDDNCVVQPLGQEPIVAGVPLTRKFLVYDTETRLFALLHIQQPNDEAHPYGISINRPSCADCIPLSKTLTAIGADKLEHPLNFLFIQYRRSIRQLADEEGAVNLEIQRKLVTKNMIRYELLKATGL